MSSPPRPPDQSEEERRIPESLTQLQESLHRTLEMVTSPEGTVNLSWPTVFPPPPRDAPRDAHNDNPTESQQDEQVGGEAGAVPQRSARDHPEPNEPERQATDSIRQENRSDDPPLNQPEAGSENGPENGPENSPENASEPSLGQPAVHLIFTATTNEGPPLPRDDDVMQDDDAPASDSRNNTQDDRDRFLDDLMMASENATWSDNSAHTRRRGPFSTLMYYISLSTDAPSHSTSQQGLEKLQRIAPADIPEAERQCSICYEPYDELPTETANGSEATQEPQETRELQETREPQETSTQPGPQSTDESDVYPGPPHNEQPNNEQPLPSDSQTDAADPDEGAHFPVKMPCGHIFGSSCLRLWLRDSISCPLCRTNIEQPTHTHMNRIPFFFDRLAFIPDNEPGERGGNERFRFWRMEEPGAAPLEPHAREEQTDARRWPSFTRRQPAQRPPFESLRRRQSEIMNNAAQRLQRVQTGPGVAPSSQPNSQPNSQPGSQPGSHPSSATSNQAPNEPTTPGGPASSGSNEQTSDATPSADPHSRQAGPSESAGPTGRPTISRRIRMPLLVPIAVHDFLRREVSREPSAAPESSPVSTSPATSSTGSAAQDSPSGPAEPSAQVDRPDANASVDEQLFHAFRTHFDSAARNFDNNSGIPRPPDSPQTGSPGSRLVSRHNTPPSDSSERGGPSRRPAQRQHPYRRT